MAWEMVKLGDVCEILNGYAFKSSDYVHSGYRVLRIKNVQKNQIVDNNPVFVTNDCTSDLDKYQIFENDILISLTGNVGRVARLKREHEPAVLNQRVASIRVISPEVNSNYIYMFLNHEDFEASAIQNAKGIAQLNLSSKWLEQVEIPLPPLPEQQRIATLLEKVDHLRQLRQQALRRLDDLVQATFLEMFGDPVTNPKGWEKKILGEVCFFIKDGPHKSLNYVEEGIPFVSVKEIIKGEWDFSSVKYISQEDFNVHKKRCKPEYGDVLYTKGGTTGFAKFVDLDIDFLNWVHIAVLKFGEHLNGRFLAAMLNTDFCYTQSQLKTRGIANRDLVLGEMKDIQIYLPPRELQDDFAAFLISREVIKHHHQTALTQLDTLFNALMQQAFTGQLKWNSDTVAQAQEQLRLPLPL